jgi:hypothetical protein
LSSCSKINCDRWYVVNNELPFPVVFTEIVNMLVSTDKKRGFCIIQVSWGYKLYKVLCCRGQNGLMLYHATLDHTALPDALWTRLDYIRCCATSLISLLLHSCLACSWIMKWARAARRYPLPVLLL